MADIKVFESSLLSKSIPSPKFKSGRVGCRKKLFFFENGRSEHYQQVVSSLPLPDIVDLIRDCPKTVKDAAKALCHTSAYLVTFGINKPHVDKDLWFYIYDEDL
ncbi:MAG: hypothetical protein IPK04_06595 [Bdellovibrionales bacterium]|nr:hypothetical protein [Bdellovibrionales bacterium]